MLVVAEEKVEKQAVLPLSLSLLSPVVLGPPLSPPHSLTLFHHRVHLHPLPSFPTPPPPNHHWHQRHHDTAPGSIEQDISFLPTTSRTVQLLGPHGVVNLFFSLFRYLWSISLALLHFALR